MANKAMDKTRKRLREDVGRNGGQLTMCRSSLLRKHRKQLNAQERIELEKWFALLPELRLAYDHKEEFFKIWYSSCKVSAQQRYCRWLQQVPPELRKDFKNISTSMKRWGEYIFNYFDHRYTNAFTESTNRRIKDIQREARNGRFETVRAKAIYGTIVRQQLRAARTHEPNPNMRRAKRAMNPAMENVSAFNQQISIQIPLF
jgi:transposase